MILQDRLDALAKLDETAPSERRKAFEEARRAASDDQREVRAAAAEAVAATGTPADAIAILAKLADDDDVGVRYRAAAAIAGTTWKARLPLLRSMLTDPDPGVVAVAADGLAHAKDPAAIKALRALLAERRLRFAALDALANVVDDEHVEVSRRLFGAFLTPPFEKAISAVVLAERGDESARKYLRIQLGKKKAEERPLILVHLARVDPTEGRPLVEAIAREADDYLRESALLALAKLDPASWWQPAAESIARYAADDATVSAEMLLGLFAIDWKKAAPLADPEIGRDDELGAAARRVRLAASLNAEFEAEVLA